MTTTHLPIYRKDGNTFERFDYQMVEYKGYYFLERIAHWLDKKGKPQSQVIQVYHLGKDTRRQFEWILSYYNGFELINKENMFFGMVRGIRDIKPSDIGVIEVKRN